MTELVGYCKGCKRSINSAMHHSFDGDVLYCEQCRPMDSLPVLDIAAMQERIAELEARALLEKRDELTNDLQIMRRQIDEYKLWRDAIYKRKNQPKPTADELLTRARKYLLDCWETNSGSACGLKHDIDAYLAKRKREAGDE